MTRPALAVALTLAAGGLTAAPVPRDFKQAGDKERIVGTWKPADRHTAWFRFAADDTLETWNPPGDASPMKWTWTNLDPKATPKRMTLTRVSDRQVYTCPYELIDDGSMRFAFRSPNEESPADFAQRGGDVRLLARDKSEK